MRRVKQLLYTVMLGCMMLMLCACENKSNEELTSEITIETIADEKSEISGKITVWVRSSELVNTKFAEYKKEFEAKYPGTEVEYKVVPNYETMGYQSIVGGADADVVMIPEKMTKDEVKKYFIPFGSTEEIAGKYKEAYIHKYEYDGVVYGIPEYMKPQGIAYNKRVLEYAGIVEIPETPEAFIDMLTTIKIDNNEIIPFYIDEDSLDNWELHAWGSVSGDPDYHYNGMVMETNPFSEGSPNYIVHKLLYDIEYNRLSQQYKINKTTAKKLLNRGDIACMLVDFDEISSLQKAGTNPDDIGYMPFPYNIDDQRYATLTYGYSYGIPAESDNKVTAEAFVSYMIKNSGYASSVGAISVKKKTSKPSLLRDFSGVTLVLDNPATEDKEGKYQQICEKSGVALDDSDFKKIILQVAKEARPGKKSTEEQGEDETASDLEEEPLPHNFDEIMELWYAKWKQAK